MLPFGGFFLKMIGGEIVKTIFKGVMHGQVNTPTLDTEADTKYWIQSKTIWGGLAVLGYVGLSIFTGNTINLSDINSIVSNGGNIWLTAGAVLSIYGRVKA